MKVLGVVFLIAALFFASPFLAFVVAPSACLDWISDGDPKPVDVANFTVWSARWLNFSGALLVAGIVCLILGFGSNRGTGRQE